MIKDLPNKLQNLRAQYGYSQKKVASKLGVSPSIISGYETGERTPSVEALLLLAYLYNTSTDYLLGKQVISPNDSIDVSKLSQMQKIALKNLVDSIQND